jgi:uncharacterized protein (DUF885 family)
LRVGAACHPACLVALACALAACTPEPPGEEEILAGAQSLPAPQPGLYRSTTRLTDYDLPQASPQDAAAMRARLGGMPASVAEHCVTAADAEEGWLALVRGLNEGTCRVERFSAGDGAMEAVVACIGPDQMTSHMAMTGIASETASSMDLRIIQNGPAIPGGEQAMAMMVTSERIGDCPTPASATVSAAE